MSSEVFSDELAKLPALKRPREPREALIDPGKVRLVLICIVGCVLIAGALTGYVITSQTAKVPVLVGLQESAARTSLKRRRLKLSVGQRLYSTRPKGTVLGQSFRAGSRVRTGRTIVVSISGGTERVTVPGLIGLSRKEAIARLEALGLLVNDISQTSQEKPGTVVSSVPVAGTRLYIGDTVVIHIASATEVITLVDYNLSKQTVVIEPRYCGAFSDADVTYDVAQRLSALVQAAGGKAVITRASTETTVSAQVLSDRARRAHPTASVAITINGSSSAVLAVSARQQAGSLGQALFDELKWVSSTAIFTNSAISSAAPPAHSVALSLGRSDSKANSALFTDDLFCDNIARALYMSLGKTLTK
ncbi:MAG: PASTA domain-containing protein [Coriobacteriia bacterium]|nr:PASTA domain-containing protein [Coriobacteriia bacterium]